MSGSRERGSAVVWVLACGALLLAIGAVVSARTAAVLARHRVEAAADLAALAGAGALGGPGDPCAAAARVAARNDTDLVSCVVVPPADTGTTADGTADGTAGVGGDVGGGGGDTVSVRVRATLDLPLVGRREATASARAGRGPP